MNNARRTVIACACAVGATWGLLDSPGALAAVNSNGIAILSTKSTGVVTGQYIEAAASVRYQHVPLSERIYTRQLVPVARSTLRTGALAALNAGRLLPGLGLAITAAGFVLSQDNAIQVVNPEYDPDMSDIDPDQHYSIGYASSSSSDTTPCDNKSYSSTNTSTLNNAYDLKSISTSTPGAFCWHGRNGISHSYYYYKVIPVSSGGYPASDIDPLVAEPEYIPFDSANPDHTTPIDDNLPSSIVDDLWFDDESPYPWEWAATNDSIDPVLNDISDAKGSSSPEVRQKAKQWAENVAAQLDGEPEPNPDTDTDTKTAEEAAYEDDQAEDDEPVPPFSEPEISWQTETLSLPSFSSGIGGGSCPAPVSVPLPGGGAFQITMTPACDFASGIRAALIGVCGIIALMIVVRARGGA